MTENHLIHETSPYLLQHAHNPVEWYGWNDSIKANSKEQWNYNLGIKPGAFNNMQECIEIFFKDDQVNQIRAYQLEQVFEKED